jgi:RNA polymerase sigma factor (sigma-70 family)
VQRHQVVVDRQLAREAARAEALGRRAEGSAEERALAGVDRDRIVQALRQLPQRQREVIVLRYYADLSEAEIAETLHIAAGSVKKYASRGLQNLRTVLQDIEVPS